MKPLKIKETTEYFVPQKNIPIIKWCLFAYETREVHGFFYLQGHSLNLRPSLDRNSQAGALSETRTPLFEIKFEAIRLGFLEYQACLILFHQRQ